MYKCSASIEATDSIFFYLGDTLLEYRNTSIGNIASGEIEIPIKADDNGAMYKCTASNKATEVPLEAVKKLTVHCKWCLLLYKSNIEENIKSSIVKLFQIVKEAIKFYLEVKLD